MNGLELQRRIGAAKWRIPIIFITSHADGDAQARALEAGAVDYLYKPFREEQLLSAIDVALKHS
jgi:two-component system response regulator DctR